MSAQDATTGGAPPVMLGMSLPDIDVWSDLVTVSLGQNPSVFTGPGTNCYLVGSGARRLLLDTGSGREEWLPVLDQALDRAGCEGLHEIVLTHGHPDHLGGVEQVMRRYGDVTVRKHPWPGLDDKFSFAMEPIADGDRVHTEGATLRAIHTPGHAPDHICFLLEEERSLFSGDNILGVGTTVIPSESGDLGQYMQSLARLLEESPTRIYPAHGPCIEDGCAKIQQYIDHRNDREAQILAALDQGAQRVSAIVAIVYAAYPKALHAAAGQSVASHLQKLERDGVVSRHAAADGQVATLATEALWTRV